LDFSGNSIKSGGRGWGVKYVFLSLQRQLRGQAEGKNERINACIDSESVEKTAFSTTPIDTQRKTYFPWRGFTLFLAQCPKLAILFILIFPRTLIIQGLPEIV
jgi:hypothetical protein